MKILHIISGLETGGAERALYNLLAGGLAKQFDCTVLSLRDEGTMGSLIKDLGVPVNTLGLRVGVSAPKALVKLRRLVSELQPDRVQGWMYHGNLAASLAARFMSVRPTVSWNIRQSLYDIRTEKRMTRQVIRANRAFSRHVDAMIYNSQISCSQHEDFGFASDRSVVIPNGFDLERLNPDGEVGSSMRQALGINANATVIGHVARFHPVKDHARFLRAAVEVAQSRPDAHFLLVGRDVSPENPALAGIVSQDLLSRFTFTDERRDVPRVLQAMDILCLNSLSEAFPNVLGEAMACAIPCVATDVGESATIISETGMLVPPADVSALAHALGAMIDQPEQVRRQLGAAARTRIAEFYSLDAIVRRYADLYQNTGSFKPAKDI